jgi:hypothetical protein
MDIVEGSYSSQVFETRTKEISQWARAFGVATAFILMMSCVVLLVGSSTTILGQSAIKTHMEKKGTVLTGINAGGMWIHDEFQPRRVWFHDSGSIHSPAEEAVAAAQKQAKHVSTFLLIE